MTVITPASPASDGDQSASVGRGRSSAAPLPPGAHQVRAGGRRRSRKPVRTGGGQRDGVAGSGAGADAAANAGPLRADAAANAGSGPERAERTPGSGPVTDAAANAGSSPGAGAGSNNAGITRNAGTTLNADSPVHATTRSKAADHQAESAQTERHQSAQSHGPVGRAVAAGASQLRDRCHARRHRFPG